MYLHVILLQIPELPHPLDFRQISRITCSIWFDTGECKVRSAFRLLLSLLLAYCRSNAAITLSQRRNYGITPVYGLSPPPPPPPLAFTLYPLPLRSRALFVGGQEHERSGAGKAPTKQWRSSLLALAQAYLLVEVRRGGVGSSFSPRYTAGARGKRCRTGTGAQRGRLTNSWGRGRTAINVRRHRSRD